MLNSSVSDPFDSDAEIFLLSLGNLSLSNRTSSNGASLTRRTHEESSLLASATPLFPESIWAGHSSSKARVSVGDARGNLQSMPSNRYMNGYHSNYEKLTVRANSGSGAPSMVIWANPEKSYGHNLASVYEGQRGLNMNNSIASLNSSLCHQQSFNCAGLDAINAFLVLQDDDIIRLGKTQSGSLYLQKTLSSSNDSRITDKIFEAVLENPFDLLTDEYGCYLFVKVIRLCSEIQLERITLNTTLQSQLFYKALLTKNGAQSMQKLIKVLVRSPWISLVISALNKRFKDLMFSREASSVIMQCLETLDDQQNEVLYMAAINHFRELATHVMGCISLNNFITNMRGPRRGELLDLIASHASFLAKDPSGNFVVQHLLGFDDPNLNLKICTLLKGKFVELSTLKYGSHLVEKCLKSPGMALYIVDDLLKINDNQLLQLAKHKYGNFVIQRALRITKNENISLHIHLLSKLQNHEALNIGLGKKVYNLIADGVPDN